jgi:hypothetical protein
VSLLQGCGSVTETLDAGQADLARKAALRQLEPNQDSLSFEVDSIGVPDSAHAFMSSGRQLSDLDTTSAIYRNLKDRSQYLIHIRSGVAMENPGPDTAAFDGLTLNLGLNRLWQSPLIGPLAAGVFPPGGYTHKDMTLTMNLETHRLPGLYLLRQLVEGQDVLTGFRAVFQLEFATVRDSVELPELEKALPTRMPSNVSSETKDFLRMMLDAGLLE